MQIHPGLSTDMSITRPLLDKAMYSSTFLKFHLRYITHLQNATSKQRPTYFFLKIYFLVMCLFVWGWGVWGQGVRLWVQVLKESGKDIWNPGSGITVSCEPPKLGCWEPNADFSAKIVYAFNHWVKSQALHLPVLYICVSICRLDAYMKILNHSLPYYFEIDLSLILDLAMEWLASELWRSTSLCPLALQLCVTLLCSAFWNIFNYSLKILFTWTMYFDLFHILLRSGPTNMSPSRLHFCHCCC